MPISQAMYIGVPPSPTGGGSYGGWLESYRTDNRHSRLPVLQVRTNHEEGLEA